MKKSKEVSVETPEKFIEEVIRSYQEARKLVLPHSRVRRGRSHSISSRVEDLFSVYLASNFKNISLYVDQPTTIVGRANTLYPDLLLVNNQKIVTNLIDVKMDLGFNRNKFVDFCKVKEQLVNEIKGKKCSVKDGITKNKEDLVISNNVRYHIVIISSKNISKFQMEKNFNNTSKLEYVKVYNLTSEEHPNSYDNAKLKKIKINHDQFTKLIENLK